MRNYRILNIAIILALVITFFHSNVYAEIMKSVSGASYDVVSKQSMEFRGDHMFVLTYVSKDPSDPKIREEEFEDLYKTIAGFIDPNSEYDYVALVALKKRNKEFGVTKNSGYRDRRKFTEVMEMKE